MEQGESTEATNEVTNSLTSPSQAAATIALPPPPQQGFSPARRATLLIAAAAGMLGTFFPWVQLPIFGSISGTQGDGWITFVLFIGALLLTLAGESGLGWRIAAALAGIAAAAVGGHDAAGILERKTQLTGEGDGDALTQALASTVSVGVGLYLVILAGIVITIGAIWPMRSSDD